MIRNTNKAARCPACGRYDCTTCYIDRFRKYIYLLIGMSLTLVLQAQEAPKKANTIIVTGVTFTQCAATLTELNYFIDKKDEGLGTIVTLARAADQTGTNFLQLNKNIKRYLNIVLFIRVKDSTAIITGKWNASKIDEAGFESISNYGMKGSVPKMAFEAMKDFSTALKGQINYAVK